jgi:hypothetical protein
MADLSPGWKMCSTSTLPARGSSLSAASRFEKSTVKNPAFTRRGFWRCPEQRQTRRNKNLSHLIRRLKL